MRVNLRPTDPRRRLCPAAPAPLCASPSAPATRCASSGCRLRLCQHPATAPPGGQSKRVARRVRPHTSCEMKTTFSPRTMKRPRCFSAYSWPTYSRSTQSCKTRLAVDTCSTSSATSVDTKLGRPPTHKTDQTIAAHQSTWCQSARPVRAAQPTRALQQGGRERSGAGWHSRGASPVVALSMS